MNILNVEYILPLKNKLYTYEKYKNTFKDYFSFFLD